MSSFTQFFVPAVALRTAQGDVENLDGQGLQILWEINRDNTNKADHGTITVLNMDPAQRGAIYEAWQALSAASGYLITFEIGWEGVSSVVFIGDVWDMIPAQRSPTDTATIFRIGDGNKTLRDSVTSRSFANVNVEIVLEYLVNLPPAGLDAGGGGLGLTYPPESKDLIKTAAAEIPPTAFGNIASGANTRQAIDMIMETLGLEWRIQSGAFIVLRGGIVNKPGPIMRPSSGLISYTERNDGGINFSAYANPELEPGIQVFVQDNEGQNLGAPVYRTDRVSFSGNTEAESLMVVEAGKALS